MDGLFLQYLVQAFGRSHNYKHTRGDESDAEQPGQADAVFCVLLDREACVHVVHLGLQ